jgi:hypothetical protein
MDGWKYTKELQLMRVVAHLCAIILLIPQVLAATAFAILHHLTAGRTIGSFFAHAFDILDLFFGWRGLVVILAILVLAGAGFSAKWRPVAAWCVVAIAILSAVLLLVLIGAPPSVDGWMFFLPGVIAIALSVFAMGRPASALLPAARGEGAVGG